MKSPKAPRTPGRSKGSCSYGQTMIASGNSSSSTHENLDGFLHGVSLDKDSSPSKRSKEDFDTKNEVERSHEDQNSVKTSCVSNLHGDKKLKNDANSANQLVGQCTLLLTLDPDHSEGNQILAIGLAGGVVAYEVSFCSIGFEVVGVVLHVGVFWLFCWGSFSSYGLRGSVGRIERLRGGGKDLHKPLISADGFSATDSCW
ncbi:hypothetical protein U1Q18_013410 [Sarracenia purpurea var. burkii]